MRLLAPIFVVFVAFLWLRGMEPAVGAWLVIFKSWYLNLNSWLLAMVLSSRELLHVVQGVTGIYVLVSGFFQVFAHLFSKVNVTGCSYILGRILLAMNRGRCSVEIDVISNITTYTNGQKEPIMAPPEGLRFRTKKSADADVYYFHIQGHDIESPYCRLEWDHNRLWINPCLRNDGPGVYEVWVKERSTWTWGLPREEIGTVEILVEDKCALEVGDIFMVARAARFEIKAITICMMRGGWVERSACHCESVCIWVWMSASLAMIFL